MASFNLSSKNFAPLPGVHQGTGKIIGSAHVADPATVDKDINTQMDFKFSPYNIQVISLETDVPEPPNWFGVSFRTGISSFNTVNIFCHPLPGFAGMAETDYLSRKGNWPKLFRYAEIFGRQIAIANANHITIVPFFTDSTYASTGIFAEHWLDLVEQIILHVKNAQLSSIESASSGAHAPRIPVTEINRLVTESATRKKGAPPPARYSSNLFNNVVLSCFSRGRELATSVRSRARGINSFVREVWDFDGVGGPVPSAPRILTYDQHKISVRIRDHFHVPPKRWVKYHNAVIANVHGDIPAMLACHAATTSGVGR